MSKYLFSILMLVGMLFTSTTFAGELDDESKVTNQKLQGTVVVRVDSRDNTRSVVHTESAFRSDAEAQTFVIKSDFQPLDATHEKTELDNDGGVSSWYFFHPYSHHYPYYPNYYNNYYLNWYGNYYQPCYSYNYGYYNYYYYSPYYWGW